MNLKYEAAKQLAALLSAACPTVGGRVFVEEADQSNTALYPCIAVLPRKMTFGAGQWDLLQRDEPSASKQLLEIGDLRGPTEIRVYSTYQAEREALEEQVRQVFMSRYGSPGLVVVNVPSVEVGGVITGYGAPCSYEYLSDEWREELVFSQKRYSFIEVDTALPVLVVQDAYAIDTLILALTEDMTTTDANAIPTEDVEIHDDGTTSPA